MPAPRASIPPPHTQTPATRASIPPLHLWREVADRLGVRSYSPSPISHICRRQMSIPPRQFLTSAVGRCLFPLAIYGGGGRQAGGEVKADRQTKCEINLTGTDKSTTTSPNTDSRVSLLFRNRIDSSVNRACPPKTHSSLAP